MKKLSPSEKVYVKKSGIPRSGRGVFAKNKILKGEIIENCPYIDLPPHDLESLENTLLLTYIFFYGEKKEKILLTLGFGSIYNHSYTPNAAYIIDQNNQTVTFTALEDIQKDEEITFNYKQGNPKIINPLWFEIERS